MSLKDTISKWHGAVCLLEQDRLKEAMQRLMQMDSPSAKIVYNMGCISMKMELYTDAIEYFSTSLEQDKYLAISHFQRGVCFYKIRSYSSAEKDFEAAKSMVPSEGIDYRQLGAKVLLHDKMIDGYSRLCRHYVEDNLPPPVKTTFMDFIFYPPKKMVANLKKEDFLGKAKVISSVQESDILYAESKGTNGRQPKKKLVAGGAKSSLSASMLHLSPSTQSQGKTARPPCRPPPRLSRSHSLGDLLDSGSDTDQTDSTTSGATTTTSAVSKANSGNYLLPLQKRQSTGDYDYSHAAQESNDSFSNYYTRLSVSSSILDQKPIRDKPTVPKRPIAKSKEDVKKENVSFNNSNNNSNNNVHSKPPLSPQPRLEFQKIHEALKGKFSTEGLSNDHYHSTTSNHLSANSNFKPVLNISSKSQEELANLTPPKRILAQSQPNLSKPLVPKNNFVGNPHHVRGTQQNAHKGPPPPVKPTWPPVPVPRTSPDRSADSADKPKPPPRPPPPRK